MQAGMPDVDMTAACIAPKDRNPNTGWASYLQHGDRWKLLSGAISSRSAFRAELLGVVHGLEQLKCKCEVRIYTSDEFIHDLCGRVLRGAKTDPFACSVS